MILSIKNDVKTFDYEGQTIEVKQYLPIEDKNDLIHIALQNAEEADRYNPVKLHMFYRLYIVYMYTNIGFSEEDKANEVALYDALESNGIITHVMNLINQEEFALLGGMFYDTVEQKLAQKASIFSSLRQFISDLPEATEKAKEIIKEFDPNDFKAVIDFAQAANGGRPII